MDEDVLPAGDEGVRLAVVRRCRCAPCAGLTPAARNSGYAIRSSVASISASRISASAAAGAAATREREDERREEPTGDPQAAAPSVARAGVSWLIGARAGEPRRRSGADIKPGRGRSLHRDGRDGGGARRGGARPLGDPHGGRPARARRRRPPARAALARGDGGGAARLHRGARAAGAPGADRAALPRLVRRRPRPRPRRGDGRLVGRRSSSPSPASSSAATGWRSAIPAIRATATSCARSTSCRSGIADRRRGPLPAGAARPRRRTSPACWSRARPTRPAPCSARSELAALIERAAELRHRLRLGRDLPRHPVRRRARSRRWRSPTRSTSSTRSRSTSR